MTTAVEHKDTYTHVRNWNGRLFAVRLVRPGERYGAQRCITYDETDKISWSDGRPLVEFYDATFAGNPHFDVLGQFVSRYGLPTLRQSGRDCGLILDSGNRDVWTVDSDAMADVHVWLDAQERGIVNGVLLVKAPRVDSEVRAMTEERVAAKLEQAEDRVERLRDQVDRLQRTLKAETDWRDQLQAEYEWRCAHYPTSSYPPDGDYYTGPTFMEYED